MSAETNTLESEMFEYRYNNHLVCQHINITVRLFLGVPFVVEADR